MWVASLRRVWLRFDAKLGVMHMSDGLSPKPLIWIGSTRDDLREFPEEVRGEWRRNPGGEAA